MRRTTEINNSGTLRNAAPEPFSYQNQPSFCNYLCLASQVPLVDALGS